MKSFIDECLLQTNSEMIWIIDINLYRKEDNYISIRKRLLYELMAKVFGIKQDEINVGRTYKGKPFLKRSKTKFNLSHTKNYLAFITSSLYEVGIDIQGNITNREQFPFMILSHSEKEIYQKLNEEKKNRFLLKLWTCKESIVKATGDGLTIDISTIDLSRAICNSKDYIGSISYPCRDRLDVEIHVIEKEAYICSYTIIK